MIRVLIADDSLVAGQWMARLLEQEPGIQVLGIAKNGVEALDMASRLAPDVIAMDIHMPVLDGVEATRRLMQTQPAPVVIVSASWKPEDVETTFRVMEAGAVAVVEKPTGPGHPHAPALARDFIATVKAMAGVRVVRRWGRRETSGNGAERVSAAAPASARAAVHLVAVGVSTGGPPVLRTLLGRLSRDFPAPILIVQHIAAGFLQGLSDWLTESTGVSVRIAADGMIAENGVAYLAPDGAHMGVRPDRRIVLGDGPPENGVKPSVSWLFRSVAEAFGAHAAGVLLTGMGRDGAAELKRLRDGGALTFAQDEQSSVVFGMPGEAVRIGAAMYVMPPERIADMLVKLTKTCTA